MTNSQPLTRFQVFSQSWPIMLANAAGPAVGLIDTFVIGRFDSTTALAGIGLGAVIYGIFYWGFGFMRMSTAGLAAQSDGAGDELAVQAHLTRAIPLGLIIGLVILLAQTILLPAAFMVYTAAENIESAALIYIQARLWGLPATLGAIALMGWFVGLSRSQDALVMQIFLNVINAALSLYFVASLGWGLWGVGIASAVAEWCGLVVGLFLAFREIKRRGGIKAQALSKDYLLDHQALSKLGVTNSNIFIRTMALAFGFNFFGNAAATQGEVFLAGNHILMQFITMIALILDAFAHTAEAVTGAAYGAKDKLRFNRAVRLTTEFSVVFAFICGATILYFGPAAIGFLSRDPAVIKSATTFLPYCALAPIVGFASWQFDGIFIGTTRSAEMRNASLMAVIMYVAVHFLIEPHLGPHGIWMAFLSYYIFRAITLAFYYPRIQNYMVPTA